MFVFFAGLPALKPKISPMMLMQHVMGGMYQAPARCAGLFGVDAIHMVNAFISYIPSRSSVKHLMGIFNNIVKYYNNILCSFPYLFRKQ